MIRHEAISTEARAWFRALVRTIWGERQLLDALIDEVATDWRVERMNRLDLSLMRLGAGELTMPVLGEIGEPAVVINEVVHLAKKYSGEDSAKFINGILGKIITLENPLAIAAQRMAVGDAATALKKHIPRVPEPLRERHKLLYPEGKPKPAAPPPAGPDRRYGPSQGRPSSGGRPSQGRPMSGGGRPQQGRPTGGGRPRPGGPPGRGPARGDDRGHPDPRRDNRPPGPRPSSDTPPEQSSGPEHDS